MKRERRPHALERFERLSELPLLVLALAMVPLLVIPFFVRLSNAAEDVVLALDWTIWGVFALDLSVRTYLADRRVTYLIRHWYDVLIVVLPFLRPLRVLRSARVLRLFRLARVLPFAVRAGVAARTMLRRRGLQYVLATGLAVVFVSAGLVYLLEREEGGNISDYGTALWWAVTTITTVGYGDTFPTSAEGRGVAMFLMLVGISFFSWVTANISAFLLEHGGSPAGPVTMDDLMAKLEALEAELRALRQEAAVKLPDGM